VTCDRPIVFSGPPVSSTKKTDHHDITEIMLKMKTPQKKPRYSKNKKGRKKL
jgi:hypothetical protein